MIGGVGGGYHHNPVGHGGRHIERSGHEGQHIRGDKKLGGHERVAKDEDHNPMHDIREGLNAFIKGGGNRSAMVPNLAEQVSKAESILSKMEAKGWNMPKLQEKLTQMKSLLSQTSAMDPQELNAMDGQALWAIFQGTSTDPSAPTDPRDTA